VWKWREFKQNKQFHFSSMNCSAKLVLETDLTQVQWNLSPSCDLNESSCSITGSSPLFHPLFIWKIPQCMYWCNSSVPTSPHKMKPYVSDDTNVLYWTKDGTVDSIEEYILKPPFYNLLNNVNSRSHWSVLYKGSYMMTRHHSVSCIFLVFMSMCMYL